MATGGATPASGSTEGSPSPFETTYLLPQDAIPAETDCPIISCWVPFSLEIFFRVLSLLVLHPERSSGLILRADILRLLPNKPKQDGPLDQDCLFLRSTPTASTEEHGRDGIVEYTCLVASEAAIPFYHPLHSPKSKLYRICLNILSTIHRFGISEARGYEKRVVHDTLVERDSFQDLYLELKAKFSGLESRVVLEGKEGKEDVKRHVWKDVSIATFLILLWRDMYPPCPPRSALSSSATSSQRATWGAPLGGFVDVGCGNGLLVHILTTEGYVGQGLELRPRKTWATYPAVVQASLKKEAVDPTALLAACRDEGQSPFPPGAFFIGNHSDEMTPWIPVLAALTPKAGFLSIPCCLHTLTGRFVHQKYTIPTSLVPPNRSAEDVERSLGKQVVAGRYGAYLLFLAGLGWETGWEWEREALRIPSTRMWGIVGRRRLALTPSEEARTRAHVLDLVDGARGAFKARKAEGNAGLLDVERATQERGGKEEHDGEEGCLGDLKHLNL